MAKQTEQNQMPPSEHLIMSINTMLANLVGEEHRLHELTAQFEFKTKHVDHFGNPVYGNPLPDALPLQKAVMRSLNHLSEHDLPPTRDNLIMVVRKYQDYKHPNLEQAIDDIMSFATPSRDVVSISHGVDAEIKAFQVNTMLAKVRQMVQGAPPAVLPERLARASSMMTDLMPHHDESMPEMAMTDLMNYYYQEVIPERVKQREKGTGYPDLKFRDFVRGIPDGPNGGYKVEPKLPYLAWGDTTLVTGVTGTGKTTHGQIWAEHNAFYLGHDVLYIHLETPPKEMSDRTIARHAKVHMDYLENKLNFKEPDEYAEEIKNTMRWLGNSERELSNGKVVQGGELVYKYCPGWNVFQINNLVKAMRMRSQINNRGLLVIVDYYDIIDKTGIRGESEAYILRNLMIALRDNVKRENIKSPVHMIVFGQENEYGTGDAVSPYGSKSIKHVVQTWISIQREQELAANDLPVTDDDGKQLTDIIGRKRYYHRKGNYDSLLTLRIIKGNKAGKGFIKVRMEGPLFRITDLPIHEVMSMKAISTVW